MSSNGNEETKGIKVIFVLEILGKPAEHLVKTLDKIIEDIGNEEKVELIHKEMKEPIELEKQKGFFSTFAEIEFEVENITQVAGLIFKYMPANIEILEPELIALTNNGWNEILNELTRRLHGYDELARVLQMQQAKMQKKIGELEGQNGTSETVQIEKKEETEAQANTGSE